MTPLSRRTFLAATAAAGALSQERSVPPPPKVQVDPTWVKTPGKTANSRFAVNVEMWFRKLPFLDRIRASADLGFDAIEFWGLGGKDLEAIAKLCEELKVEVAQFTAWGFVPGLNDPKNHEAFLGAVHAATQAAKVLRARKATVVGGNDQPGMSQEQMISNITVGLQLAAPIAEAANLMLILEPMNVRVDHFGHCLHGSADALKICRAVDSPMVKINWDLYHMQISEGDLCGHLRDGIDQVGYLQLADHPGRNEPGTGEVSYARVLHTAQALGYKDIIGLECYPQNSEAQAAQRVHQADLW